MHSSFLQRSLPQVIFQCSNFHNVTIYNSSQVRQVVSDFAVIIAIFSMSALDYFTGIDTPKLEVPVEFKPTLDGRGWMIWPFNENPWWSALVAGAPALLGTILIFMDQQITAVIVNRKENKLKVSLHFIFHNTHAQHYFLFFYIFCLMAMLFLAFIERMWLSLGSLCPSHSHRNLLCHGTSMVCGCNSAFHKSRKFIEIGI